LTNFHPMTGALDALDALLDTSGMLWTLWTLGTLWTLCTLSLSDAGHRGEVCERARRSIGGQHVLLQRQRTVASHCEETHPSLVE